METAWLSSVKDTLDTRLSVCSKNKLIRKKKKPEPIHSSRAAVWKRPTGTVNAEERESSGPWLPEGDLRKGSLW